MRSGTPSPTEVAVVGAGAVGLTLAARLAQHGVRVQVFEAEERRERIGSRAICMQRETLEIWARIGVGEEIARRGVQWTVGRTYFRGKLLFEVHLPEGDEHFPPFVNISQSEVEERLEARLADLGVAVHRGHRLTAINQEAEAVAMTCETPDGVVEHRAEYLVGTDGAHSSVRHAADIGFSGYTFDDRFLIADVRADLPFTNERHFHFDPPWNPGRQVLIHPQPDGVWRIDWQVSPDTDADEELASGRLDLRVRQVIGADRPYELVWMTAYRFSQRLADAFRVGRVFLAGDAAHVMSPFGARGLNSGVADAENLAWKLARVLRHGAPDGLLDTYESERRGAALENLAATEATMRFMAPHGPLRRGWRNFVLRMAPRAAWFRRRVNSGRLAEPARYGTSPIVAPGAGHGAVVRDRSLPDGRRLRDALGAGWTLVTPVPPRELPPDVVMLEIPGLHRALLVRPDGYVAASAEPEGASGLARRVV
ncbi:MAG: FAD-dependent monooxygenase [Chloroflexota bacterium]|nr:FAD-dependent monooxygenase [Chloroflexota bacterium]